MRRKRATHSSWSGMAFSEHVEGDQLSVQGARQAADGWEQRLLDDLTACMEGITAQAARGEDWELTRHRAVQQIILRVLATVGNFMAPATVEVSEPGWDELTRAQREIMRLHAEGRKAAEIAALRHIAVSTVNTHLRNARERLRERKETRRKDT